MPTHRNPAAGQPQFLTDRLASAMPATSVRKTGTMTWMYNPLPQAT
jgi:hypothetical protein